MKLRRTLSDTEQTFYRKEGYIVVGDLLDGSMLQRARDAMNELLDGARSVTTHDALYDLEPDHVPDAPRVRRLKMPHRHHPFFMDLARSADLLDIVEQLVGPDIRVYNSKINFKPPRVGSPVEWHQDFCGFPHTNDDLLTATVLLDEVTEENGPLLLVPGTHTGRLYDHHVDGYYAATIDHTKTDLDFTKAVPVMGAPGTVSFHHCRLVHGSAENDSAIPRTLLLYTFSAVDAWPLAGIKSYPPNDAEVVRGKPSIDVRLERIPARVPLPLPESSGSIYERQRLAKNRYFG